MSFLGDIPEGWKVRPDAFVSGISWLPIPLPDVAALLQVCEALHKTEYDEPETIHRRQLTQARQIVRFAKRQSEHYRSAFAGVDVKAACVSRDAWRSLPVLTRADVQAAGDSLFPAKLPPGHRKIGETQTSGSTGQPVTVRTSNFSSLFFAAFSVRDQLWHRRDINGKLARFAPT